MVQKIMKCGLIGGFILFIWGAASWTILPWQKHQMKRFINEKEVTAVIRENAPTSGLYTLPSCQGASDQGSDAAFKERLRNGPCLFAAVSVEGRSASMVGACIQALIVKIIAASLVAWLLFQTKLDANRTVKFVTVVGIAIAVAATLPYVIWFGFPGAYAVSSFIEIVFGWFFAGLAMARIAK